MSAINNKARVAGVLYLLMLPFAIFSLYTRFSIIIPNDPVSTIDNIIASQVLFKSGIVSWLMVQTIQVFLAVALYRYLKPINKNAAIIMMTLIAVAIPISIINELNPLAALLLLIDTNFLHALSETQQQIHVQLFLNLHTYGTIITHIFWGLWLLPMGYLILNASFLPKILGMLIIIAGLGYLVDFISFMVSPHNGFTVTQFTFIGEITLPLWLIIKNPQNTPLGKAQE